MDRLKLEVTQVFVQNDNNNLENGANSNHKNSANVRILRRGDGIREIHFRNEMFQRRINHEYRYDIFRCTIFIYRSA